MLCYILCAFHMKDTIVEVYRIYSMNIKHGCKIRCWDDNVILPTKCVLYS